MNTQQQNALKGIKPEHLAIITMVVQLLKMVAKNKKDVITKIIDQIKQVAEAL